MIVPELVDGCNLKCELCWNRNRHGSFDQMELKTIDRILEIFGGGRQFGGYFWYNWGEPLLHENFHEFAELVKRTKSSVSSNFSLLLTDKHFESLRKIKQVVVSMSGLTPEVYNIYHVYGNHKLVMENMEKLRGFPCVRVNWLRHPYNEPQFNQMKEYCEERNFEFGYFRANCEVEELIAGFSHPFLKIPRQYRSKHLHKCKYMNSFFIDVKGNYLVCCTTHNIKIGLSIWDNGITESDIIEAKKKSLVCQKCNEHEYWRMF